MGITIFNFSIGEVYRRIYVDNHIQNFDWGGISSDIRSKFNLTATRERSRKT